MNAGHLIIGMIAGLLIGVCPGNSQDSTEDSPMSRSISLPEPAKTGSMSLEEALSLRRSRRYLTPGLITLQQVSQILWAAQGITAKGKYRTAPSAGALYPIEIYLAAENVGDLEPGLYHYVPQSHSLSQCLKGSLAKKVTQAALGQGSVTRASAIVIITAVMERTSQKYGERTERYVAEEVGAIAQNIYLQVESLGLATVLIGAFVDEKVQSALEIKEMPLAIMPIGRRSE